MVVAEATTNIKIHLTITSNLEVVLDHPKIQIIQNKRAEMLGEVIRIRIT